MRAIWPLAFRSRCVLCRANTSFWPISLRFTLTGRPLAVIAAQRVGVSPGHSRLATPASLDGCVKRGEIGQKLRGWRRIAAMRRSVRQPVASACRRWVRRPPARRSCLARPAGWRLRSGSVALAGGGASCLRPESRWPLHRGRLGGAAGCRSFPGRPVSGTSSGRLGPSRRDVPPGRLGGDQFQAARGRVATGWDGAGWAAAAEPGPSPRGGDQLQLATWGDLPAASWATSAQRRPDGAWRLMSSGRLPSGVPSPAVGLLRVSGQFRRALR